MKGNVTRHADNLALILRIQANKNEVYLVPEELDEKVEELFCSAMETLDVSRLEDVETYNTLASTPYATLHRHPHHHAHALCSMLQSQEHPHTPGGSGLGSRVVRRTTGRTSCGTLTGTDLPTTCHATPPRKAQRVPLSTATALAAMVVLSTTKRGLMGVCGDLRSRSSCR